MELTNYFFINFAFSWCSQSRPEAAALLLVNDDHSPDKQRVNTAVSNQDEYREAFNCHERNTPLLETQCRLW